MQHVYLLTIPESFSSGVLGAMDLLRLDPELIHAVDGRGADRIPTFRAELVGGSRTVHTRLGPPLTMDRLYTEAGPGDIVYIPPLLVPPDREPAADDAMIDWLCSQYEAGAMLCAACTGTLTLAATGLLDDVPATTHWAYADIFRRLYPRVDLRPSRTLVVGGDDMRLVTAGAHASWYDLMLYLLHRFAGADAARRIAKIFLLDWHDVDQNAYASFRDNRQHEDNVILDAQEWLNGNLTHPEPVDAAQAHSGLPERSFHRRFRRATGHTPLRYVQRLRVERAKDLLESSDLSVDEVAWRVGYGDCAYFRRLFKRVTGLSPAVYRRSFRTPANVADQLPG